MEFEPISTAARTEDRRPGWVTHVDCLRVILSYFHGSFHRFDGSFHRFPPLQESRVVRHEKNNSAGDRVRMYICIRVLVCYIPWYQLKMYECMMENERRGSFG